MKNFQSIFAKFSANRVFLVFF